MRDAIDDVLARHVGTDGIPGAAVVVGQDGRVAVETTRGSATAFGAGGAPLPPEQREPVIPTTRFDLASLTKLVTALVVLRLVDGGELDLDRRVADLVPAARAHPWWHEISLEQLLVHSSGLPPTVELDPAEGDRGAVVDALLATEPLDRPGNAHVYSCVGYLVAGVCVEHLTGEALPDVARRLVLEPCGLRTLSWAPDPERCASTEVDDAGVPLRGVVHDEAARALGGAGNAGAFGTADDVFRLGEVLRTGHPLSRRSHERFVSDALARTRTRGAGYGQGVGPRIGDPTFMGRGSTACVGHTGFTGTAVVVDPSSGLTISVLTNGVHPRRGTHDLNALRREVVETARRHAAAPAASTLAGSAARTSAPRARSASELRGGV